jgi:hypothetical protein
MLLIPVQTAAITNSRVLPIHVIHSCIAVQRLPVLLFLMQALIPGQFQ